MSEFLVEVSDKRHKSYDIEEHILSACGARLVIHACETEDDMIRECADADGVLLDMAPFTRKVAENLPRCKIVVRYGVGYDNVDVPACTERGIRVAHVPDYCVDDVSEMALALIFSCLRRTAFKDRMVREGKWNLHAPNMVRLTNKVVALIGFGRISQKLNEKLNGMRLKEVVAYDPFVSAERMESQGVRKVSFEEAMQLGDIVSLHLPLNEQTQGMVDSRAFELMRPQAFIINTSRGALIDEQALIDVLQRRRIAGAGLDTFVKEPLGENHPLYALDNCVLTDHTGYNTEEGVVELKSKAAESMRLVLEGKEPLFPLNSIGSKQVRDTARK